MRKLLYITDQQEYMDHGTMTPLFEGYLKEHFEIKIVFYTKFKHSLQTKGDHIIVPEKFLVDIIDYLEHKKFDIASYDYVFVRNRTDLLQSVLNHRNRYNYKACFRLSLPKTRFTFENMSGTFLESISKRLERLQQRRLIERCDLFLPASATLSTLYFPDIKVATFALVCGIDPKMIRPHSSSPTKVRTFIYTGTIDELRSFKTILEAFKLIKDEEWKLVISTFNSAYLSRVLENFKEIRDHIKIISSENSDELLDQISQCDVGIALTPPLQVYTTTMPSKTMDYASASAAILTNDIPNYRAVLGDDEAYFCDFEPQSIATKLKELISSDTDQIRSKAAAALQKFIAIGRGYDKVAQELAKKVEEL